MLLVSEDGYILQKFKDSTVQRIVLCVFIKIFIDISKEEAQAFLAEISHYDFHKSTFQLDSCMFVYKIFFVIIYITVGTPLTLKIEGTIVCMVNIENEIWLTTTGGNLVVLAGEVLSL